MSTTTNVVARSLLLVGLGCCLTWAVATPASAQEMTPDAQQIQVLPLKHASAMEVMRVIEELKQGSGIELAGDASSNALVVKGSAQSLEEIKRLVGELDTEQGPTDNEMQLRLVWLVAGLADDAAAAPPADLEGVTQELATIGVTNLTMAAQMVINITEGQKFSVSGSAKVNEPCTVKFTGMLGARGPAGLRPSGQLPLQLEITATALADDENTRPLCQLQTTVKAPLGRSAVVGVTPIDSKPSVFVVQVLPRAERARDVKKD